MPSHFASARLKLERAKHHIQDLNRQVGKFFASGAVTVTIEEYPERAQRAVVRKTNKPVPNEFSLILGDAIHNARVVLDLMTWEAITPYTQTRKPVQFPVGRNKDHFLKQPRFMASGGVQANSQSVVRLAHSKTWYAKCYSPYWKAGLRKSCPASSNN